MPSCFSRGRHTAGQTFKEPFEKTEAEIETSPKQYSPREGCIFFADLLFISRPYQFLERHVIEQHEHRDELQSSCQHVEHEHIL